MRLTLTMPAATVEVEGIALRLPGAPRTKKTSNRLVRAGERSVVLPSKAFGQWQRSLEFLARPTPLLTVPVGCCALVYREAERGDLIGYLQGLADVLQHLNILKNDAQIVSWDGSRMLKDPIDPRIDLLLTTLPSSHHHAFHAALTELLPSSPTILPYLPA